jgi:hypothetical protein
VCANNTCQSDLHRRFVLWSNSRAYPYTRPGILPQERFEHNENGCSPAE